MPVFTFPPDAGTALGTGGVPNSVAILQELRRLGLPADGVRVELRDDDRALLTGSVPDTDAQERIVLAVGNLRGVAGVDDRLQAAADNRPDLLGLLGGFAHLPAGAAASDMAEEMVHDATPREEAFGPAGSLFHTLHPGESLATLAVRQYGDANAEALIAAANRPMLPDPARAAPGTVVRLPRRGA